MPFGAELLPEGGARFRLWAPSLAGAQVLLTDSAHGGIALPELPVTNAREMHPAAGGWHETVLPGVGAGSRYALRVHLEGGGSLVVPDPASRSNPDGVHASSEVIDPGAHRWRHDAWRGRPWEEAVIYELHVGCFTPQGTFAAAAERLPSLAKLGITALQIMPLAAFPGTRNWGYDGVLPFAPAAAYGAPDDLKALIDAAHGLHLMVLLDVVYNHFGPDGNYLYAYCPEFFNPAHRTPWGSAVNFDGAMSRTVREFFVHNAL
jgi:maltooligosyltrehalose trehalohydrolase